jgi:hypothetical protein
MLCALVTRELDNSADVLEGQVERRLPRLLHELSGVCFVTRAREPIVNREAHIVPVGRQKKWPTGR